MATYKKKIVKIPIPMTYHDGSHRAQVEGALRLMIKNPHWVMAHTVPVSFKGLAPSQRVSVKVEPYLWEGAKKAIAEIAPMEAARLGCRVAGVLQSFHQVEREWLDHRVPTDLPLFHYAKQREDK